MAFGLRLACARPLPGLVPFTGDGVDVHVTLEPSPFCERSTPAATTVTHDASGIRVDYPTGTTFTIHPNGGSIQGRWPAGQTVEDAICYLVGPILRTVLRLRGVTVLHGSAVAVDGNAIAILGPSGAGKSTTAAALVRAGAALLTDDTVTLPKGDQFRVLPGYRGVRLWPNVAPTVCSLGDLYPITPTWDKRFLRITGRNFREESAVLGAVYVLKPREPSDMHRIEPLHGREAFVEVAANVGVSYADDRALRAEQFDALTDLVKRVPVRSVTACDDLAGAATLAEAILADARRVLHGER